MIFKCPRFFVDSTVSRNPDRPIYDLCLNLIIGLSIFAIVGCERMVIKADSSIPERLVAKEDVFVAKGPRPVIVVRWPAVLDNNARVAVINILYSYFQDVTGNDLRGKIDYGQLPDLLPYQSTFYAADLFFAIRTAVPGAIVLLEPTLLQGISGNKVATRPLSDISIPIDLVVDISVEQSAPQTAFVSGGFYFNLRGRPSLSSNCGVYISMEYNYPSARDANIMRCASFSPHEAPFNIWWSGESFRSDSWPITISSTLPPSSSYTIRYPLLADINNGMFKSDVPPYVHKDRPRSADEAEKGPRHPYVENFGRTVALAVKNLQNAIENPKSIANYVEYFDKQLSQKIISGGTLTAAEDENLKIVKKILNTELMVRAKHDDKIARELSAGNFGQSFRDIRLQMYKEYDKRMLKTWTSVASGVALHGALINNANSAQALIGAENTTINQFNSEMAAIGRDYYKSIAPLVEGFESAAIEVGNGLVTIRAKDQAALRNALIELYRKHKVRTRENSK